MLKQELILTTLNKLLNQVPKIRKGTDAVYFCPFCNHYKRKLEINLLTGKYNCWVCNFRGISLGSLFKKLNASAEYYVVLNELSLYTGPTNKKKTLGTDTKVELPSEFKPLYVPVNDPDYKNAIRYLQQRNIGRHDILRYNIGYCDAGLYKGRVVIPSYDADGMLNFFSARDYYGNDYMKYKLCSSSKNIIGFELFVNFEEPITLVEGQFDAIAVRRNSIPLFGKNLSEKLKSKLLESDVPKVNVLLDNDAEDDAIEICEFLLKNGIQTHIIQLPDKDPSSLGFEKTWEIINNTPALTFKNLIKLKLK